MKFRGVLPIPVIIPLLFLVLGSIWAHYFCYRDPTSVFFDSRHAYNEEYSETRRQEANEFIRASNNQTSLQREGSATTYCVGIPTVARRTTRDVYVDTTIGSLLGGLDPRERDEIHLILFIAHSDPSIHPIYRAPWLDNVVDQTLSYQGLRGSQLQHVMRMENSTEIIEKQIFDYAHILDACMKTNASYIVTIEDDILAIDGWFHRTKAAVKTVEEQVKLLKRDDWLYLRLFYTEQLLGWNSEFWLQYLSSSFVITIAALSVVSFYLERKKSLRTKRLQVLGATVCYCALAIGFFFACGRISMLPRPRGVQQMPRYGCCAQGLVLNRAQVPGLIDWYHGKLGYVDSRAEEFADIRKLSRWAVTPSVIQHVGTHSSKAESEEGGSSEISTSQQLHNFEFELYDPRVLAWEHQDALLMERE